MGEEGLAILMVVALFGMILGGIPVPFALAASGSEARERFAEGPWDCILTDVVMPGMNGVQLHRTLAGVWKGLPALFMSGYTADGINYVGRSDNEIRLLPKPFHKADLGRAVREALNERAPPMALRA